MTYGHSYGHSVQLRSVQPKQQEHAKKGEEGVKTDQNQLNYPLNWKQKIHLITFLGALVKQSRFLAQ